jgi:hypothetical protein
VEEKHTLHWLFQMSLHADQTLKTTSMVVVDILEVAVVLELKPISKALTADRKRAVANISDSSQASQRERTTGRNGLRLCNGHARKGGNE